MRRKHGEMNLAAANAPDTLKNRVTIGDIVTRTPITFSGFGNKDSLPMKGTVIIQFIQKFPYFLHIFAGGKEYFFTSRIIAPTST